MAKLIDRLAQQIVQDNAIFFIGADLRGEEDQLPIVQRVAEILAERIGYDEPDRSLPAVAQSFEVSQGRNELIKVIQEECEHPSNKPMPVHQLIADVVMPYSKVITTRFDRVLEQALRQVNKRCVLIVRDTDVPSFDETWVTLVKIHGDITQPDSLVITEDDIEDFIDKLPTVSDLIRAFFATKTLIFLGYDLNGDIFRRFFRHVGRHVCAFQRRAYAIVPQPLKGPGVQYWRGQNVEISVLDPVAFLGELAQAVKEKAQGPESVAPNPLESIALPPRPPHPYRALDSFTGADVAIFCGRVEESQRLTNRVFAHRLTVLYGESGSGKTSLLQAGVGPRLAARRALLALCVPAPGKPLADLMYHSLADAGQQAGLESPPGHNLAATIRTWQRTLDGPVVLAVDQFEQFFLVYNREECQKAADLFSELMDDRSLDLRLVLVLREDFLGRLQVLEDRIPGLLDVRFRLERLDREAARAAIEEPASLFGIRWEPALVQTLLDDLYESASGGVAPPQLQIVCDRIYQQVAGSMGEGGIEITLAHFQRLGGTQAILGDYLGQVVLSFPPGQQPTVRTLLGALVSSSGVKQRLGLDDLARTAEVEPETAARILEELTRQRIVRRYKIVVANAKEANPEYELMHDCLVTRIARWLGSEFWEAQQAREIVRQSLSDWQSRAGLLAADDLSVITAQQDRVRFSPEEMELIYASAVGYDNSPSDYRTILDDTTRQRVLLRLLAYPEAFVRERAACALAAFPGDDVAAALVRAAVRDSERAVREAAARALAQALGAGDEAFDRATMARLVEATADPVRTEAAMEALAAVRDLEPTSQGLLPMPLRRSIRRRVWTLRWRRNQQQILATTVRGAQGGFWGLGLGLGMFLGLNGLYASGFDRLIWQAVVSAMSVGIPLAGVLGVLAAGSGAFVGVALRSLQDREQSLHAWAVVTGTSAAMMGLGFVLLGQIFRGVVQPARTIAAGLLIGLGLAGAATAPLKLSRPLRLGLAMVVGMAAFVLAWALGLIFSESFWWLLLMGGVGGAGFFWGLNPDPE